MGADKCIQVGKFIHLVSDFLVVASGILDWFEIPAIYELGLHISVRKFNDAIVPIFDIGAVDIVIVSIGMPLAIMVHDIHHDAFWGRKADFLISVLDMRECRIEVILYGISKKTDVFHDVTD
jgi:hypothetical protein